MPEKPCDGQVAAVKSYPLVLEFISPDMRDNEKASISKLTLNPKP